MFNSDCFVPEGKWETDKIKKKLKLCLPTANHVFYVITLRIINQTWQPFCHLDCLIVSLATTFRLYSPVLNKQCRKSLGLGRELLCWNTSSACLAPFPVIAVKALLCALWLQPHGHSWLSCQALNASGKRRRRKNGGRRAKLWWKTGGYGQRVWAKVRKKNETRTQQE